MKQFEDYAFEMVFWLCSCAGSQNWVFCDEIVIREIGSPLIHLLLPPFIKIFSSPLRQQIKWT
jgi:hypothetical protein